MLLVPCHLKKNIKMALGVPVTQTQTIEKPKVICANVTLQESKHSITAHATILKTYKYHLVSAPLYNYLHHDIQLPDVFAYLHIKVPARILHQQFLI